MSSTITTKVESELPRDSCDSCGCSDQEAVCYICGDLLPGSCKTHSDCQICEPCIRYASFGTGAKNRCSACKEYYDACRCICDSCGLMFDNCYCNEVMMDGDPEYCSICCSYSDPCDCEAETMKQIRDAEIHAAKRESIREDRYDGVHPKSVPDWFLEAYKGIKRCSSCFTQLTDDTMSGGKCLECTAEKSQEQA